MNISVSLHWLALMALLTAGLALGACGKKEATVPDVIGKTAGEARNELAKLGFKVIDSPQLVPEKTPGQVIGQDPPAGTTVTVEVAVTLAVAASEAALKLPNLVRVPFDRAKAQLEAAGLQVKQTAEPIATLEFGAGEVVSQSPAAFSPVAAHALVELQVAGPSVAVPDVTGQGVQSAVETLVGANLLAEIGENEKDPRQPVASTLPEAGAVVLEGARVILLLQEAVLPSPSGQPSAQFAPNENWTHGPYYGAKGTYFADVTGDGKADAIVVNDDTVTVRRSDGSRFTPNENWTNGPYYGGRGTYFADVTGDGKADAIVVNDDTVTVRRSDGSRFTPNENWTHGPYYGGRGTYFADVTGDGKADAIVVNGDTVTVRRSDGSGFKPNENWTHGPYYGGKGTYFADVTGDGKADAIVVNDDTVTVRRSDGSGFKPNENWTQGPYYGGKGTYFADVTGDGKADAIVVNGDTVTVRRSGVGGATR